MQLSKYIFVARVDVTAVESVEHSALFDTVKGRLVIDEGHDKELIVLVTLLHQLLHRMVVVYGGEATLKAGLFGRIHDSDE